MLDYDYIKNQYKLKADLSRQKGLDANSKTIQQIEFTGQYKNNDALNVDSDDKDIFSNSCKNQKKKLKFYQEKMVFCKNQRYRIEILSRKHNGITKK